MKLGTLDANISDQLELAILEALPGANVKVAGANGHFQIEVTSERFAGKNAVQKQRLVYSAIKHLMAGDAAPVHAIDSLKTLLPE